MLPRKEISRYEICGPMCVLPPLYTKPEELPRGQLSPFRLREKDVLSAEFILTQFMRAGGLPLLRQYETTAHGKTPGQEKLFEAGDPALAAALIAFWSQAESGFRWDAGRPVALVVESDLGRPKSGKGGGREGFLFLDLDGVDDESSLGWVEDHLAMEGFGGAISWSGASAHYTSSFRIATENTPLFYAKLIRLLTPVDAWVARRAIKICNGLETAQSRAEVNGVANLILDKESDLFVPSEASGYCSGSFADIRYVAHQLLDDRLPGVFKFGLRVTSKPGRPIPTIVSVIK